MSCTDCQCRVPKLVYTHAYLLGQFDQIYPGLGCRIGFSISARGDEEHLPLQGEEMSCMEAEPRCEA